MSTRQRTCIFCSSATADIVPVRVLEQKWCQRFGGEAVVALDHGWYTNVLGERTAALHIDPAKFFAPEVRAVCDYCAHGWMEDVRWRAEPVLLSLAEGRPTTVLGRQRTELVRWAALTAMLAERVEGMPIASSCEQRDGVRRGSPISPPVSSWFFVLKQRLPARVHLSQVQVGAAGAADAGLVQVISVDLAHLSAVVVVPSDHTALGVLERAALAAALDGRHDAGDGDSQLSALDLSQAPHPHQVAVQRLCSSTHAELD